MWEVNSGRFWVNSRVNSGHILGNLMETSGKPQGIPVFTRIYPYLPVLYQYLPVFTRIYPCLPVFPVFFIPLGSPTGPWKRLLLPRHGRRRELAGSGVRARVWYRGGYTGWLYRVLPSRQGRTRKAEAGQRSGPRKPKGLEWVVQL